MAGRSGTWKENDWDISYKESWITSVKGQKNEEFVLYVNAHKV